ncbi:hypothetical protein L686_17690 [Stutzerimonas stutzeri MF28]|nr:hypothetical protein L686_17690 [Stutzerimonas stutzeri MF28]
MNTALQLTGSDNRHPVMATWPARLCPGSIRSRPPTVMASPIMFYTATHAFPTAHVSKRVAAELRIESAS